MFDRFLTRLRIFKFSTSSPSPGNASFLTSQCTALARGIVRIRVPVVFTAARAYNKQNNNLITKKQRENILRAMDIRDYPLHLLELRQQMHKMLKIT